MHQLLQQQDSVGNHSLAGLDASNDLDFSFVLRSNFDLGPFKLAGARFKKDIIFFALQEHGLGETSKPGC